MKRFILTTAVALSAATCISASDYVPMIREGRVWEYRGPYEKDREGGMVFHYMKFDGTVSINGMEYHQFGVFNSKFYRYDSDSDPAYVLSLDEERDGPVWFLREEAGKVYALTSGYFLFESEWTNGNLPEPDDSAKGYGEILLYDFTLEEGAQMILPEWGYLGNKRDYLTVYKNPVMIDGDPCKVQQFVHEGYVGDRDMTAKPPYFNSTFPLAIEGVGVTFNGCLPNFCMDLTDGSHENNSRCPGAYSGLRSVRNASGDVIYGLDSPAGLTDFTVESDFDMITYDVLGRRVSSTVPGGVYIRGGKKFVAK